MPKRSVAAALVLGLCIGAGLFAILRTRHSDEEHGGFAPTAVLEGNVAGRNDGPSRADDALASGREPEDITLSSDDGAELARTLFSNLQAAIAAEDTSKVRLLFSPRIQELIDGVGWKKYVEELRRPEWQWPSPDDSSVSFVFELDADGVHGTAWILQYGNPSRSMRCIRIQGDWYFDET